MKKKSLFNDFIEGDNPSERDEGVKILVNSCISKRDRIGMRVRRKTCVQSLKVKGMKE